MEPGQRLYEVYQEELDTGCEWGCNTTAATRAAWAAVEAACVPAADAEFKNFHRMLCERFDYAHDERDWKRDQVSLMEWIAKRVEAACASQMPSDVAALVERLWSVDHTLSPLFGKAASALQAQAAEIAVLKGEVMIEHCRAEAAEAKLREAVEVVKAADEALNYVGDVLNNMDAVLEEDVENTTGAFDSIRAFLSSMESSNDAG